MSGAPEVLEIYAGPGGWDEGARMVGVRTLGLEWDAAACSTRAAAGHATIRCDVAAYPVEPFAGRFVGILGGPPCPPCPPFSAAGKGEGRKQFDQLLDAVELCRCGWTDAALAGPWTDERTPHVLQALRYVHSIRPEWCAFEQVPPVLPLWERMADVLRASGYDARALVLNAADFGVPQTRERAFLLAHRTSLRLPVQSHEEHPQPCLFGNRRMPWLSIADVLPITAGGEIITNQNTSSTGGYYRRSTGRPSPTLTSNVRSWKLNPGALPSAGQSWKKPRNRRLYEAATEPAPSIAFGHHAAGWKWITPDGERAVTIQ